MKKYLFLWVLPVGWAVCSLASFIFPGDEYGLYGISSFVGVWIVLVVDLPGDIHSPIFPLAIAVTGSVIMACFGLILTKLRVNTKLWLVIYVVSAVAICVLTISSFESFDRAMRKNGSLFAYIFYSMNMGMYTAVLLSITGKGLTWLFRKTFRKSA